MMNSQTAIHSNPFIIFIPRNYPGDIHICGGCKMQYNVLSRFQDHKATCTAPMLLCHEKTDSWVVNPNKPNMEVPIEILDLGALTKDSYKEVEHLNTLNSILSLKDNHDMPLTIELHEEFKRPLQNDEEVIAALLANQLGNQAAAGEIVIEETTLHQGCEELNIKLEKRGEEGLGLRDEGVEEGHCKVLYRGKMRKLLLCSVDGCPYKTLLRKDYERHERVHTGERPFKCGLCSKAFTRADKLLLHERIHSGDKRYKCTECDYACVDSGSLIKHLRVHNGERPFKCQLCSYRARDSSQLTVHLRTHTGDSPFTCTNGKCKSAFKTNSDLKRHMVVHSGQKPHACLYCPYRCTLKRNLQIHVQSQHPNGELKEYMCRMCPRLILPTIRRLRNHVKKYHQEAAEAEGEAGRGLGPRPPKDKPRFEKRRRKSKGGDEAVPVGVMNKAFDCKLCDASFVCKDSLLTHERYHSKQCRTMEMDQTGNKEPEPDENRNHEVGYPEPLSLSECSMEDSLRSAEILASLNLAQHVVSPRQLVMLEAGHVIQYNTC